MRLLMPIDHITGWLCRVARNRIIDLFRKKKSVLFSDLDFADEAENEDSLHFEDLLPSPDAGPDSVYARGVLLTAFDLAISELPPEQREVFVAHEIEGLSFKAIASRP